MKRSKTSKPESRRAQLDPRTVAQVSKPAVSPISKSAGAVKPAGLRVWKPTIQQTGKSALQRVASSVRVSSCTQSRKRRIFLVDDHPVTREGLARLINLEPDLEVCGEAGAAARAVVEIEARKPDLVIIDVSLATGASGLELIKDLAARHPRLPMLTLSTHDEILYAERALRAGAKGYVMKQEPTERVMQAIRKILSGEIYLSKAMSDRLLRKLAEPHSAPLASEIEQLSDRELEVYRRLGQGRGTRQIAEELHLSVSTVETHRTHIKEKLHLASAPELVRHAVEWVHSQAS